VGNISFLWSVSFCLFVCLSLFWFIFRRLKGSLEDEKKKKFVTGEWFNEVKAKRFQEDLEGPDLLRASIKKKNDKPNSKYISLSHLNDVFPEDSGTRINPFWDMLDNSQLPEKGHEIPALSTRFSERDLLQSSSSSGVDVPDAANETPTIQRPLHEETSPVSKIPVKRKPSKGIPRSEMLVSYAEQPQGGLAKRDSLKSSKLPSLEGENNRSVKQGANYTISSMSNKDEEIGLDREHFKNLKNFWEKGAESVLTNNVLEESFEKPSLVESNGKPFRLSRSLSVQSNQSQNGDEKPSSNLCAKARIPYHRTVTLSSSEEEPSYVAPLRKGSGSSIPRSTYGKSKGAAVARNNSLSESSERQTSTEEERKTQRCSRKSKLPVRVPLIKLQSPAKEQIGSIFEPETPAEEYVMPEENRRKVNSLANRVQIMIEPIQSCDEVDRGKVNISGLDIRGNLGTNGEVLEDKPSESADSVIQSEPAGEMALARANNHNLARSMVNIYTTSETYSKPQTITHQLLEPERAKELSRSTPVLLSETESDTASEISFQFSRHRKSPSIGSHSSDMASVSSVSGSVLSVYSGDFGSVDAQGTVQFALDYDEKNREFQIYVSQCKDLAVVDEKKGRTDPYVKTYLLPDKARMGKRKTSAKKRTVNPVYNEVLRYKIEKMVLLIQKLNLSVWHNDPLGRNSFLGEMEIDLASWDWSNKKLNWYMLKPRSLSAINGVDHRGVMNLAIKYVPPGSLGPKNPSSGEVHIWVKDTKDLPQLRPSGVDSFVKCYVLPDTSKKSYQKTRVIKRDPNPVFNHTIVYDGFHTEDLKDACVELTVWDHEKLTNHFLGGIRLGLGTGFSYGIPVDWMDSTQEEVAFWQEMMSASNEWIEGSLLLRSLAGRKKLK
uniref:Synaptotagmin-like protein 2 n=1 Tax=Sphenodon punctatus TaxID=8508 RepID=A0A8D0G1Y1_SPHPU